MHSFSPTIDFKPENDIRKENQAMTVLKNSSPLFAKRGKGELEMPFNEYFLVFVKKRKLKSLCAFLPS